MCGIVGYVGDNNALNPVIYGLKNLEYRGYDSSGIAFISDDKLYNVKQVGRVANLETELQNHKINKPKIAIGHTRWATHGTPTKINAHPHHNQSKTICVVHNGIIENYTELKDKLIKIGYEFISQTDSEVIPHLIDHYYKKQSDIEKAFRLAINDLDGAYAIVMISTHAPDRLFAAKLSSPLVIGVGKNSYSLGSDTSAIADTAKKIVYLDDYQMATLQKNKYTIKNYKDNLNVNPKEEDLAYNELKSSKGSFEHYMLKEIYEAPLVIQNAILGRIKLETHQIKLGGIEKVEGQLRKIDRFIIIACGTSYYAGLIGEYLLEDIAGIPVEVRLASEFKYSNEPIGSNTALLAISQSGETADTIAALKKYENSGILRLGIVNATGSTITRMTDAGIYCHAGPEISVASTKAFIAQVSVLTLLALWLGQGKYKDYVPLLKELVSLPKKVELILKDTSAIQNIAKQYSHHRDFMYMGRGYEYPMALEAALKLKEISYIHAEGYAAGEMKHGPLAMIDKNFPTFALAAGSKLIDKTLSNLQEIKARNGKIIVVTTKANIKKAQNLSDELIIAPEINDQLLPLIEATVVQLFAYYVALSKGLDIDKPRNLAKSVTVE